jgi:hypothetical protein
MGEQTRGSFPTRSCLIKSEISNRPKVSAITRGESASSWASFSGVRPGVGCRIRHAMTLKPDSVSSVAGAPRRTKAQKEQHASSSPINARHFNSSVTDRPRASASIASRTASDDIPRTIGQYSFIPKNG